MIGRGTYGNTVTVGVHGKLHFTLQVQIATLVCLNRV
jgi:hypothetical protein